MIADILKRTEAQQSIDDINSSKRIKKAVKEWVQEHMTADIVTEVITHVTNDLAKCKLRKSALEHALMEDGFTAEVLDFGWCNKVVEPSKMSQLEKTVASLESMDEYHRAWSHYSAIQSLVHLQLRIDSLDYFLKDKAARTIKDVFKAILSTQIKSKKEEVIVNALVNPIARAMNLDLKHSSFVIVMNVLQSLSHLNLIKMRTVTGAKGGIEWMVAINLTNVKPITRLYRSIRTRYSKLVPEEVQAGDSIVSKHKFAYDQTISEGVAEAINILNAVPLKIELGNKSMTDLVVSKLEKDGIDRLSQDWMRQALYSAQLEYDLIQENGEEFYISHFTDGVNRIYENTEYFGVQQGSMIRKSIRLAHGEPLNEVGRYELELAIACASGGGIDKKEEEEAHTFFVNNQARLRQNSKLEDMFRMLDGKIDNLMVEQDENNSGPQFFAIGTGNGRLGRITGLVDGERFDAYILLAELLNQGLGTTKFNRDNVKSVFMTKLYNAGKQRLLWGRSNTQVDGEEIDIELSGAQTIGKLIPLMTNSPKSPEETWEVFNKAMWIIAPRAMEVMALIMKLSKNNHDPVAQFVMPDGAICQMAHTERKEYSIQWCDNKGKQHRMQHSATILVPNAKDTGYAPRIIQGMDAYALRELVRRANEEDIALVTIHDAFLCHPNYARRVRELYREVLADMLDMDILSDIVHQLFGTYYQLQNKPTLTRHMILNSHYGLWY